MIVYNREGAALVEFDQTFCARNSKVNLKIGLDAYLLLVKESKDMETLRVLVFKYAERNAPEPGPLVKVAVVR